MKKQILIVFVMIIIAGAATAQSCLPEGITFNTQVQIDSFQINYPNCTEIEGDVTIMGEDITNLNGLSVLSSIVGGLSITGNVALTTLTGLNNVTSIGSSLTIVDNAITNLMGLDNLISVGSKLRINNNALTSLAGLGNLTSVGNLLSIQGNESLTDLTGLENLTSIGFTLIIGSNDALTSLTGLINLTSIGGCPAGGSFYITENAALTSLAGLDNLTSIDEELIIERNDVLTSLTGLDNINGTSIKGLYIDENPLLSSCEVESICEYLAAPNGTVSIYDNATGCNNQEEVRDSCEANAVDINEQFIKDNLIIYPNPAAKTICIYLEGSFIDEIVFYNLTGQMMLKTNPENNTYNISSLKPGMYIIDMRIEGMKLKRKLLVK